MYVMKKTTTILGEAQSFYDQIQYIKKSINIEKDKEKRSALCSKLWHAYYREGSSYFDQGEYKAALQPHLKALEFNEYVEKEEVFNLLLSIGVEYEKLCEYDQAISYYKNLLKLNYIETSDKCLVFQFIGQCYDKKGEEKIAYDYFNDLFRIDQNYDGGWYMFYRYAKLAYKYRDLETATKYFNVALKEIPAKETGYIQSSLQCLGYIFLEKELYKSAVVQFKKALKIRNSLDKVESEILSSLAQAYFGQNKFSKTVKYAKKSIEKPVDDEIVERSYFLLAFCYSVKKDKNKEQYYINKLKHLKPNSPYLRELL